MAGRAAGSEKNSRIDAVGARTREIGVPISFFTSISILQFCNVRFPEQHEIEVALFPLDDYFYLASGER